ncbi:hypothetical protein DBY21_00365 [Candidatus Gastranaerophilales bacterium]|nr:MAG: hypothetical protein DBY21_00365 [Candidatus Gastranaerophilales bacterium]
MTNISAMRSLAELNKLEEARNSVNQPQHAENKFKFSLFGFGFGAQTRAEDDIPPEEKGFNHKV